MMPEASWLQALPWLVALAVPAWLVCTLRRNVGLVDIVWPLFILLAGFVFLAQQEVVPLRGALALALATAWGLRLAIHLALRNWNAPEDHRYQAIRARNQPGYAWKSFYLVFLLQAGLAFIVSAPLHAALHAADGPLGVIGITGMVVAAGGLLFEAIADFQLARFVKRPENRGQVMDRGLWRYTRHPNYFGEFCVWWGLFLVAASAGGWWSLVSPLLMSVLLLRVSGVTLLEKDLGQRRPGYAAYAARTNAFFPGPPRSIA